MRSHGLLPGNSSAADLASASDYQRIDLRSDRLFWDEVYRLATLSHRAERDTATSTDLVDRGYWTRSPGGIAARTIGATIRKRQLRTAAVRRATSGFRLLNV